MEKCFDKSDLLIYMYKSDLLIYMYRPTWGNVLMSLSFYTLNYII